MGFRELARRLNNWGRWGEGDERGTLNLITPERLVAAAALVRTGRVFDLGIPLGSDGPQNGQRAGRVNPIHLMSMLPGDFTRGDGGAFADDYITMPLQAATQWDALAHCCYDGVMYNGVPASAVTTRLGATKLAITAIAKGVAGRGVLLDIARLKGVDWLAVDYGVTVADLEAAERQQGVRVGPGDILLVRTGWRRMFTTVRSADEFMAAEPGLTVDCCSWLYEREVAAVASDNWAIERMPSQDPDARLPVHYILIRDVGMTLGEIFDLEELAADCAGDGVWEFLFVAPPLKVTGGVGSPINPLALK
jgi:kynurenine formamidase